MPLGRARHPGEERRRVREGGAAGKKRPYFPKPWPVVYFRPTIYANPGGAAILGRNRRSLKKWAQPCPDGCLSVTCETAAGREPDQDDHTFPTRKRSCRKGRLFLKGGRGVFFFVPGPMGFCHSGTLFFFFGIEAVLASGQTGPCPWGVAVPGRRESGPAFAMTMETDNWKMTGNRKTGKKTFRFTITSRFSTTRPAGLCGVTSQTAAAVFPAGGFRPTFWTMAANSSASPSGRCQGVGGVRFPPNRPPARNKRAAREFPA